MFSVAGGVETTYQVVECDENERFQQLRAGAANTGTSLRNELELNYSINLRICGSYRQR
jgi:hypothetical protein